MSEEIDFNYIDDTVPMNYHRLFRFTLIEDSVYEKGKTFIFTNLPLLNKDIFYVVGNSYVKYYIRTLNKRQGLGFKYQFGRVDGNSVLDIDLDKLKKGTKIRVKGMLGNE